MNNITVTIIKVGGGYIIELDRNKPYIKEVYLSAQEACERIRLYLEEYEGEGN